MSWLIDGCQNSLSADQYRLTASWAQVSTHWVWVFFWSYPLTSCYFSNDRWLKFNILKCIWNTSCSWAPLLKFWFQTDFGRENSSGFYMQGRQSLLTFLTIVTRWSRSSFNFYALPDWSKFDRWVHAENFMQRLETCLLIAEADRVFLSSCDVLNCRFLLDVPNEIELLRRLFCVIHGVYCSFGWEMHRLSKSLEIRFQMASFSKMSLLTCPCLFAVPFSRAANKIVLCNSWRLLPFWLRNAPLVKVIGNPISDGIVFKNELTHLPLLEQPVNRLSVHRLLLEAYKEGWKVSSDSGLTWWPWRAASRLVGPHAAQT